MSIPTYLSKKKIRPSQIRSIIASYSQSAIERHFPIASSFRSFCVPRNWFACKGSVWIYVVPRLRSGLVVYFRARYFLLRLRFLTYKPFAFISFRSCLRSLWTINSNSTRNLQTIINVCTVLLLRKCYLAMRPTVTLLF